MHCGAHGLRREGCTGIRMRERYHASKRRGELPASAIGRRNRRDAREAQQAQKFPRTQTHLQYRQTACLRSGASAQKLGYKPSGYCYGFSEAGFSSADLAVAALGFEAADITAFGCQKSAGTLTISSVGLLSSGEKR